MIQTIQKNSLHIKTLCTYTEHWFLQTFTVHVFMSQHYYITHSGRRNDKYSTNSIL